MWRVRFPSFCLLYRKIVPKRTSKRPQSLEDGHWGRCRTQTRALTVRHFVFPNFLVWKWSEEKKVVGSKQTVHRCVLTRFCSTKKTRKWTGIFLFCCKHFYKVSVWHTKKTHMKYLFNRISRKMWSLYCQYVDYYFEFLINMKNIQ